MQFDGKIWLKLRLTENSDFNLPLPLTYSYPVPRKEIKAAIDKQKEIYAEKLLQYIKNNLPNNEVKKATKALKSLFK